jgi:carbamoyltransferase
MRIIGIHDGHNASACLLTDGQIEYAIQEERISRIKNHSTFPSLAVRQILEYCQLSPSDVDYFVFGSHHMPRNRDREELKKDYKNSSSAKTYLRRMSKKTPVLPLYVYKRRKERSSKAVDLGFSKDRIVFLDHHLTHAAAAYFGCPWWRNEPVLVLTNDAGGDGLCATVSIGNEGKLERICEIPVSESVGYIYSMITFLLGMVPEEHEYKVMGMAPYSSKDKHRHLRRRFEELVEFTETDLGMRWERSNGCPHTQYSYRFFRHFIHLERFDWICGGLQEFFENFLSQWVRNCIQATGIHKIALSGGVFMNVKANKRIMELPEVESLFILPSCGDETHSLGAAFLAYAHERTKKDRPIDLEPLGALYFGPEFEDREIETVLKEYPFKYMYVEKIEKEIARLLARGEIVARFKGRMEFGARALGNRSILADPSRREVIMIINEMIKKRDFWMPFAPSILPERESEYLINPKNFESPYMIMSFDTTDNTEELFAASHPSDRTVRPQVVYDSWNPDYYSLLKEFEQLTGRGAILNTSFNLHGYPIVCTPKDALQVFSDSGLRFLGIGNYLVKKKALKVVSLRNAETNNC